MNKKECITIESIDFLRTAIASGEVALLDVEYALQARMDDELSKASEDIDVQLVGHIQEMLQLAFVTRYPDSETLQPKTFDDILATESISDCDNPTPLND